MKKKLPTIRDVAAAAQVSTATVSKYINGTQKFSAAVEANLKRVIEELGYQSNPQAQSMITGRTKTIGLSILDISNPHFTSIVKGANRVAMEKGYTLLLVDTDETLSRERPLLEALSRKVDGMIVFSRLPEQDLEWLFQMDKPLVFFGRIRERQLPSVGSDDRRGTYMLAQHLVALGHKHIAYVGFAKSRRDEERMSGVQDCLDKHQLSLTKYNTNAATAAEGERLCSSIMLSDNPPDALICYNDLIALGFMKEAQILGFKLPDDISVTGIDNILYGRFVTPALTSVDLQSERMGVAAMEKLLQIIAGSQDNELTVIEPQLVLRASTMRRN